MLRSIYLVSMLAIAAFTTGCSIDSSLFGVKPGDVSFSQKTAGSEIVSGSTQYSLTANDYQVSASAGAVYDKINGTTANNYQVFITVQGQMISEEQ